MTQLYARIKPTSQHAHQSGLGGYPVIFPVQIGSHIGWEGDEHKSVFHGGYGGNYTAEDLDFYINHPDFGFIALSVSVTKKTTRRKAA